MEELENKTYGFTPEQLSALKGVIDEGKIKTFVYPDDFSELSGSAKNWVEKWAEHFGTTFFRVKNTTGSTLSPLIGDSGYGNTSVSISINTTATFMIEGRHRIMLCGDGFPSSNNNYSGIVVWNDTGAVARRVVSGDVVHNLTTAAGRNDILAADQGKILNDKIGGDLSNLTTETKTSLIAAINEVAANGGGSGIKEIVVDTDDLPQVTFPQSGTQYASLDIVTGGQAMGYQGVNYKYLSLEELVGDTPGVYQLTVMSKNSPTTTWLGVASTIPTITDNWSDNLFYALQLRKVTHSSQDVSFPFTFTVIVTKGGEHNLHHHFVTWTLFNNFSGSGSAMYSMGRYKDVTVGTYKYTSVGYLSTGLFKEVRSMQSSYSELWAFVNQLNYNIVRSDYNVNTSSSYAYIENRPFYDTRTVNTSSVTFNVCQDSDWYNRLEYTVAGQWNTYDDFTSVGNNLSDGQRVKITIAQGTNSSTFTGKIYVYDDEGMMEKQVTIYSDDQSEGKFAIYASYNTEMYPGVRLSAEVMGTLDATEAIDSITVEPVVGELKQLDSKFIKIDNNTIKVNANGELYVDIEAVRAALGA